MAADIQVPEYEYRFCERKWRFDYAWPEYGLALEVQGGTWMRGRRGAHKGVGAIRDMEKFNEATIRGWRVLQVTPQQMKDLSVLTLVKRAISNTGLEPPFSPSVEPPSGEDSSSTSEETK